MKLKVGDIIVHRECISIQTKIVKIVNDPLLDTPLVFRLEMHDAYSTHSADFIYKNFATLKQLRKEKLDIINKK